jgi:hypothetical protein
VLDRTVMFGLASVLGLCLGGVLLVAPAMAGRPVPGARYFGLPAGESVEAGFVDATGEVRVSQSGRSIAPTTLAFGCGPNARDVQVRLSGPAGRRSPVRIAQDGRFTAAGRGGVVVNPVRPRGVGRYRLGGRFLTRHVARIVYTERRLRSRRVVCRSAMQLYRDGVPPFSGCRTQRAAPVLWGDSGRLFEQYAALRPGARFFTHLYACLFDSPSKRIDLGENYAPDDYREHFRLAGPFVAFFRTGCAMCTWPQAVIEVRDGHDGSLVRRPDVRYWTRLADLELTTSGSVAWTLESLALAPDGFPIGYPTQPPVIETREVWAHDSQGQRLLDSGPNLDLNSLALNGSTLTWINDGVTRAATLD